jgi:hypothetical protein
VDSAGFACKVIPRWGQWAPYTPNYNKYHKRWQKWKTKADQLKKELENATKKRKQINKQIEEHKKKMPKWNKAHKKTTFNLTTTCQLLLNGLSTWMKQEDRGYFYHIHMDKEFTYPKFTKWLEDNSMYSTLIQ